MDSPLLLAFPLLLVLSTPCEACGCKIQHPQTFYCMSEVVIIADILGYGNDTKLKRGLKINITETGSQAHRPIIEKGSIANSIHEAQPYSLNYTHTDAISMDVQMEAGGDTAAPAPEDAEDLEDTRFPSKEARNGGGVHEDPPDPGDGSLEKTESDTEDQPPGLLPQSEAPSCTYGLWDPAASENSPPGGPESGSGSQGGDPSDEDWRSKRKHVFVLSEAGKPIYSRYGSVEALSTTMGVMTALVSFVQSAGDAIRAIYAEDHKLVFLQQGPLLLVAVSRTPQSAAQLRGAGGAASGEAWAPVCLPRFNPDGFFYAYVARLDAMPVCLLLLGTDPEAFHDMATCRRLVEDGMHTLGAMRALREAASFSNAPSASASAYSVQAVGAPGLRHFLYKPLDIPDHHRQLPQFTSPELEAPYSREEERQRLSDLYHRLHARLHNTSRPLRLIYHVAEKETLLAWVTSKFELYTCLSPLVTKAGAILVVTKLLRWVKKEEDRLFIRYPPKYSTPPAAPAASADQASHNGLLSGP
ncbi:MON1 B-like protein [Camelus ferus]|nr:MON1 B-like protein [Camelus ferus]